MSKRKVKQAVDQVICKTQGNIAPCLVVSVGIHRCGTIKDGVCLTESDFGGRSQRGGYVLSFADLKAVYLAACAARRIKP